MNDGSILDSNTAARQIVYREDTLYQLKLELDTSLETNNMITFTKELLNLKNYKGKPLDMYPYFAPYKIYRKGKIRRMSYQERVELFFNRQRFEQVIFGKKSKTKRKQEKRRKVERKQRFEELKEKNFIFTIKMLFSTAFPIVDNFSQSSSYFNDNLISGFDLKDKGIDIVSVVTGGFDKKFSYLKINNEVYTITKVIWIDDVFNHPLYNKIVDNYRKIEDDKKALETRSDAIEKRKNFLLEEVNKGRSTEWNDILTKLDNYTTLLTSKDDKGNIITGRLTDTQTNIIQANTEFKEFDRVFFNTDSNNMVRWNKIKEIIPFAQTVISQGIISRDSRSFLTNIINNYESIRVNSLAIDYIKKLEFQFLKEEPEDREKIKNRIAEIFPRASEFSQTLASFSQERRVGNPKWNNLLLSRQLEPQVKEAFSEMAKCYTNENCNIEKAKEYIEVELDEIMKRPDNARVEMYEAYLQVNLVEGEVTYANYKKIKCKYLDEELDNLMDNIVNPQDDWNIQNDKNYFSVKDVVEKANNEISAKKEKRSPTTQKKKKGKNVSTEIPDPTKTKKNNKK